MERTFGAVLTNGYFTFTIDSDGDDDVAVRDAYSLVSSGGPAEGVFNMPGCPGHSYAPMRINPAHVVGVILIPEREL